MAIVMAGALRLVGAACCTRARKPSSISPSPKARPSYALKAQARRRRKIAGRTRYQNIDRFERFVCRLQRRASRFGVARVGGKDRDLTAARLQPLLAGATNRYRVADRT
jgi:hypothetical protein